jgi:hypothetical protein
MLPLYSNAVAKRQFTVVYRGYDLDLTRAPSGWCVGVHPKTADLPILVAAKSLRTTRIKQWLKPRVE